MIDPVTPYMCSAIDGAIASRPQPEQPIDAPDDTLSDADQREAERRAGQGFDERDEHFGEWICEQFGDASVEIRMIVRAALAEALHGTAAEKRTQLADEVRALRNRFISEMSGEYVTEPARDYDADARAEWAPVTP